MRKSFIYPLIFILLVLFSFKSQSKKTVRYLPLGDSYTIGTGATQQSAWPTLLAAHLNAKEFDCTLPNNPARNGYTTQNLIDNELPLLKDVKPNFVTLLIGVNDWVQGVSKASFEKNLIRILNEVQIALPDKSKILLVTIPDFGVTPEGKNYSRGRNISEGIAEFNTVITTEATKRKLPVVDIFDLTKAMGNDASLVARDGLHPSAKEYAIWETIILPEAVKLLK